MMKNITHFIIFTIWAGLVIGCGSVDNHSANTLTILAGSELKDLETLLPTIQEATELTLQFEYIGTLDGAEMVISGSAHDLAWFSHAKYLTMLDEGNRVKTQEKIMLSPVVLGVKQSKATEWGWVDNPDVTWRDIEEKAATGALRYAMTNPVASNSGFTSLVGVAAALADVGDALQIEDINHEEMQRFFKGQVLTAGSSGWLAESYVNQQAELDGMINYESVLLSLNQSNQLTEKLHLVYPKEGIITADYPLMLLNEEKREMYDTLVTYLRSPAFQEVMMTQTLRRPAIPAVQPSNIFPNDVLIELPFPNQLAVIDALLWAYLDEQRIPSHAIFVLDVSGSMEGERLQDLKQALKNLTGVDTTLTGRFARFRNREKITLITFNDTVQNIETFDIQDVNQDSANMQDIRNYVDRLVADGGTAIYDALIQAYTIADEAKQSDPDRYYSIVLMSDGANTDGIEGAEFIQKYNYEFSDSQRSVKTFPVLFGNSDIDAMTDLAYNTSGRVFNAQADSLSFIFKQIRGYQ